MMFDRVAFDPLRKKWDRLTLSLGLGPGLESVRKGLFCNLLSHEALKYIINQARDSLTVNGRYMSSTERQTINWFFSDYVSKADCLKIFYFVLKYIRINSAIGHYPEGNYPELDTIQNGYFITGY